MSCFTGAEDGAMRRHNPSLAPGLQKGVAYGAMKKTCEKNRGRIETREHFLISDLSWMEDQQRWAGLEGAGLI